MWVAAFLGMSTIYAEALIAQKYKQIGDDGVVTGGPVYYIRAAFKGAFGKVLAGIFAVLLIFARLYGKCGAVQLDRRFLPHGVWYSAVDRRADRSCTFNCGLFRRNEAYCKGNRDHRSSDGRSLYCGIAGRDHLQLEKYPACLL